MRLEGGLNKMLIAKRKEGRKEGRKSTTCANVHAEGV